ncbi:uncharacterized protein LOC106780546 [Vigna radiata var. radiata]|uniref:Dynein light chain n=1 Tax=Vigna radiata var. radiata TaxID=3916 RepID=A0A1S3W1B2_VIGRR|nr:uncharacterized protein LOC106780546 [Vigna radiata var. radiata]
MLEGKTVVRETDMSERLKTNVTELAHQALDAHKVSDCLYIAHFVSQHQEGAYGNAWNSMVGKDFRSCITHFHLKKKRNEIKFTLVTDLIYVKVSYLFSVEMEFLIFKDGKGFTYGREEASYLLQES